jgi:hypothetical protein
MDAKTRTAALVFTFAPFVLEVSSTTAMLKKKIHRANANVCMVAIVNIAT